MGGDIELDGQEGQDPEQGNDIQPDDNKGGVEDDTPAEKHYKLPGNDKEFTADELHQHITGTLLPDYTVKSQKLSEFEKVNNKDQEKPNEDISEFVKPGWEPKTYEELRQAILWAKDTGKQEALRTLEQQKTEMDAKKAEIDNFFIEVKKSDKDFDEQDFSEFVLKHSKDKEDVSLADIKSFHSVYKELGEAKKLGEESALKNKDNRTEKVSGKTGESGSEVDFSDLRGKGDIRDITREAHQRLK